MDDSQYKLVTRFDSMIIGSIILTTSTLTATEHSKGPSLQAKDTSPNIIMIVCDDLGLGDLACYGNTIVQTPNIDKLVAQGIRLEQYYAAAPISGPSRVSLMTGRYAERSGYRMSHEPKDSSLKEPWLARLLREQGYSTAAFGKWHVGQMGFQARGFDEWSITSPGGWADYYSYKIFHNSENPQKSDGVYATDYITNETIQFIDKQTEASVKKPFFAYVAYTAPHFPLQVPEEEIAPYRAKGLTAGAEVVYGMISRMDKGVGRILATLNRKGFTDNTLIIFTSDNGPEFGPYKQLNQHRFNCGLSGQKTYMLEGGIRVPCIVSWPKKFEHNNPIFKQMMLAIDWAPTILTAAGFNVSSQPFDGVSFLDAFNGKVSIPSLSRFWCYNKAYFTSISNAAMREGDWKLHRPAIEELNRWDNKGQVRHDLKPEEWQLFNIADDPSEKTNLAQKEPKRLLQMVKLFDNWWEEMVKENLRQNGESAIDNH
jgi:arylsulfatase A-like enzyme